MIRVVNFSSSEDFAADLKSVAPDIQDAANAALKELLRHPSANKLRLHPLKAHKPTVWKIDVFPNKSWQIAFNLEGETAILLHLYKHKKMDSTY